MINYENEGGNVLNTTLHAGVNLHIIPTTQFATTQIVVNFANQKDQVDIAGRALVADMLETASAKFPSQTAFSTRLSELYGADFSAYVTNTGAIHALRLTLTVVHDAFATGTNSLLADSLELLAEIIFNPMGDPQQGFDVTMFERQKENALDGLADLREDKGYIAARAMLQHYFDNDIDALAAFGDETLIEGTTAKTAWAAWQAALQHDQIDIVVMGDVDTQLVQTKLAHWAFANRKNAITAYFEHPLKTQTATITAFDDIIQTRLVQGYHVAVPIAERFSVYVFNALLGGLAVSRLFLNVREKAGLAYAISSDYNPYSRLLMIEVGLERQQVQAAQNLIAVEIERLQTELLADEELTMIKKLMIADYMANLDRPSSVTERVVVQFMTQQFVDETEWVARVQAVTATDIQMVAQRLVPQVMYQLTEKGE